MNKELPSTLLKPRPLSLDVIAGIRKLAPSPLAFWRVTGLGDAVSGATFLRCVAYCDVKPVMVKTVTEAYHLLLSRLGLAHADLDRIDDFEQPAPQEWVDAARQVEELSGQVVSPELAEKLRDLRLRAERSLQVYALGLREGPKGTTTSRHLPREEGTAA